MDIESNKQPLVSIIVITYNSSKYVIETLESTKAQTYQNIELIVSDDCSTDNTVEICRSWITKNKNRFVRTELISVTNNTGIPANCNRGVKAAEGEWVKLIAGDDLLTENCIADNIDFIIFLGNKCSVVFSIRVAFKEENSLMTITGKTNPNSVFNLMEISASDQYQLSLRDLNCPPNTLFINIKAYQAINGCDELFPLLEDTPLVSKLLKAGYKFYFLDKETFLYRIHSLSTYNKGRDFIYPEWYFTSYKPVIEKYRYSEIFLLERFAYKYAFYFARCIKLFGLNRRTIFTRLINKALMLPAELIKSFYRKKAIKKFVNKYRDH